MNIFSMAHEIIPISYAMVRKSALPDFPFSPNFGTERVGVPAFDELNGALNRHVFRRSEQQMHMLWHDHERVQFKLAFPPVPIKGLQKEPGVRFDYRAYVFATLRNLRNKFRVARLGVRVSRAYLSG